MSMKLLLNGATWREQATDFVKRFVDACAKEGSTWESVAAVFEQEDNDGQIHTASVGTVRSRYQAIAKAVPALKAVKPKESGRRGASKRDYSFLSDLI
jgi:hypothetical protein